MTWQPIETAPKDGTLILLSSPGGVVWQGSYKEIKHANCYGWSRFNSEDVGWHPTHWQPLPAPPVEGDKK